MTDAAELVQHSAQLRLEHDDDRDDDVEGGVPEEPRQEDEVELCGDLAYDGQQDEPDYDLRTLGTAQQAQFNPDSFAGLIRDLGTKS